MTSSARVGIVVVSHSQALARAAVALAGQMTPDDMTIEIAAGTADGEFGTDAMQITEAITRADGGAGVLVLADMGSAVLSTEFALEMVAEPEAVLLSPGPLVEGLVVAAVAAASGAPLADVAAEAEGGLAGKAAHLPSAVDAEAGRADPPSDGATGVFTVRNAHGLHARPAARLVSEARTMDADIELRNVTAGVGPVPATSLSRVATLGARHDHEVEIHATGAQAAEAVQRLTDLAQRRFDEGDDSETATAVPAATSGPLPGAPGVAVGPARRMNVSVVDVDAQPVGEPAEERRRFERALDDVRREIADARRSAQHTAGGNEAGIFDAHLALLDDDALQSPVRTLIDAGTGAARAWADTVAEVQRSVAELSDAYLRERAADVAAVGQQVLHVLTGSGGVELPAAGVLVADDLTPAQTAQLDLDLVHGVLLAQGSPTAHAAILARARAVPLVVSAGDVARRVADGATVAIDGSTGDIVVDGDDDVVEQFRHRAEEHEQRRQAQLADAAAPAVTADGIEVVVGANLGSVADADAARTAGADDAGLVRTEFLFLNRDEPPDVDEQTAEYDRLATALDGRRITLRTLDVGGDKPLPYLPTPAEQNPFLGHRGVRLSLAERELLRTQLTAIARTAAHAPVSVMVPMVATPAELREVREMLDSTASLRFGMMVEVPSAALKIDAFVPHVDFVSIGTNDLTQYTMAAERGNAAVAALSDPLDPGVLRLVRRICVAADGRIDVGVCGEAAGDPAAVALLVGLGIRDLSVAPPAVPAVKDQLRRLDTTTCANLADRAVDLDDAAQVRQLVANSAV